MKAAPARRNQGRAIIAHALRLALLVMILLLMRLQQSRIVAQQRAAGLNSVSLHQLQILFPTATALGEAESHGGKRVLQGTEPIGYVLQTFPEAQPYLGFSGPTNTLIGFDLQGKIVGLSLLSSLDTRDHVGLIRNDPRFLQSLNGKDATQAGNARVDAVTGATLTSLAILQGVQARLGRHPGSLKFPDAYTLADARRFFPTAEALLRDRLAPELWRVEGKKNEPLGWLLSNSPVADELSGYQGPTRAHLGMRLDGKILGLIVDKSFDNEPYVGTVRGDEWFAGTFNEKPWEEWAKTRWEEAGIEGVSGATMTSQTIAEGLLLAAQKIAALRAQASQQQRLSRQSHWKAVTTISLIFIGLGLATTRLRHITWIRPVFQIILIVVLGLINGDLLSMAMFTGWAQSGIPWQNALGLISLAAAALIVPVFFKQNLYCDHLCPHGAVQQLLPRRWKLRQKPKWLIRILWTIRPVLLVLMILIPMLQWNLSLVDLEPFDAYAWRAAGNATLTIAIVGLIASLFIPMGYCQHGCPTGAVLGYLRRHSRSDQFTRADAFALTLFAIAGACSLL